MKVIRYLAALAMLAIPVFAPVHLFAQNQPVTANITTATAGVGNCASVRTQNNSAVGIIVSGTWTGTLTPNVQISTASGAPTIAKKVLPVDGSTAQATITANGGFIANVAGFTTLNVCATAWTSGTAVVTLYSTPAPNNSTIAGVAGAGTFPATSNGLVCDGATDDAPALNTLWATVHAAGGTIVMPTIATNPNGCLLASQVTAPNNADTWTDGAGSVSSQNPTRITCAGGSMPDYFLMSLGATVSQIKGSCLVKATFNAAVAKILTLGLGALEIDHIAFVDTSTDCANFLFTSNTRLYIHDNAFVGSTKSVTAGPYSCNDAIVAGGTDTTQGKVATSPFQGYGTVIANNFFNQVRRALFAQIYANDIKFVWNKVWSQSGSSSTGPVEFNCGATCTASGTSLIEGNLFETTHYLYGVNMSAGTFLNHLFNNNCYDSSEFSTICANQASQTNGPAIVQNGFSGSAHDISASDVWTTFIGVDTNWSRTNKMVNRTDDFLLNDRSGHYGTSSASAQTITDTAPQCTMAAGTCTYTFITTWAVGSRCSGTWNGTGTLTGILKIVSSTTTAVATSSVNTDTAVINMVCVGAPR